MKEKEWYYIYITIKEFCMKYYGRIPDERITGEFMQLYTDLMQRTKEYRERDPETDARIQNIMSYMFNIFQSLEILKKKL